MKLLNKIHDSLKQILIAGSIVILLGTTITCGSEENEGSSGNNDVGGVAITKVDVGRLRDSWQDTLSNVNDGVFMRNQSYTVNLMLSELYTENIISTENLTISFTTSNTGITYYHKPRRLYCSF